MKTPAFLLAAALIPAAAWAGPAAVLERAFSRDWTKVDVGAVVVPPAPPAAAGEPQPDGPIHVEHNPVAHMFITLKAYEMYAARYDSTELAQYLGTSTGSKPGSDNDDTIIGGSYYEDSANRNPWNETIPELRHFWDRRQGPTAGLWGYDSSVNRAQKYMTGGYGLDGTFDEGWTGSGVQGEGVYGLYKKGDKARAFWYLGHAAHLLEDLTVPAHALLFPHPFSGDAYESYMKVHHAEWADVPAGPIESFDTLFDLFDRTGDVTNDFDAGRSASSGHDGKKDLGARRARGFPDADLVAEGDVLMPLAYRRVAALFLQFYKNVDKTAPSVRLNATPSADGTHALLRARATDAQSGVDRRGYRFEIAEWTGVAWSSWKRATATPTGPEMDLELAPGRRYATRVSAVDAVGNRGLSEVEYLTGESAVAAR
jgi:hypothetical protein